MIKTSGQIVAVWSFALVALPAVARRVDRVLGLRPWRWRRHRALGTVLLLAGSALGFSSASVMARRGKGTPVPFDAARELVVAGPYRVVRNPMVIGGITQSAGVAVLLGSTSACVLPVGGIVLWSRVLRPPEERFLVERFGEPYERYRRAVPLWRPTWTPYRG